MVEIKIKRGEFGSFNFIDYDHSILRRETKHFCELCGMCLGGKYSFIMTKLEENNLLHRNFRHLCCHCYLLFEFEGRIKCCGSQLSFYRDVDRFTSRFSKLHVICVFCGYKKEYDINSIYLQYF